MVFRGHATVRSWRGDCSATLPALPIRTSARSPIFWAASAMSFATMIWSSRSAQLYAVLLRTRGLHIANEDPEPGVDAPVGATSPAPRRSRPASGGCSSQPRRHCQSGASEHSGLRVWERQSEHGLLHRDQQDAANNSQSKLTVSPNFNQLALAGLQWRWLHRYFLPQRSVRLHLYSGQFRRSVSRSASGRQRSGATGPRSAVCAAS